MDEMRFELGQTFITPAAMNTLHPQDVLLGLSRHSRGDWGVMCEEDKAVNEAALKKGGRLFSAYRDRQDVKFWIITEADRSVTTILLPEDY